MAYSNRNAETALAAAIVRNRDSDILTPLAQAERQLASAQQQLNTALASGRTETANYIAQCIPLYTQMVTELMGKLAQRRAA